MLVANMNAQEICVFLKLCTDDVKDPLHLKKQTIEAYHEKPALRGDRNNMRKPMLPKYMLEKEAGGDIGMFIIIIKIIKERKEIKERDRLGEVISLRPDKYHT